MQVSQRLDDVITIFKYLADKDIFEDFYKQHLASRLLHHKSHSDHHEKAMIAKLKTECGHQYTSKLEGMFKDIAQSRATNEQWHAFYAAMRPNSSSAVSSSSSSSAASSEPAVELEAKVLTTGFWPIPHKKGATLPPQILSICEQFRSFYCNSHSGRKLTFDASRGSAELRVQFDGGPKDLVCHTYSMCILLLYNEKDTWKWGDMHRKLGIDKVWIHHSDWGMLSGSAPFTKFVVLFRMSWNGMFWRWRTRK